MSDIRTLIEAKSDIDTLKKLVISDTEALKEIFEIVQETKGTAKYTADKVIRAVAEENASLLFPHFDILLKLLDSSNSFIKWGTILTIPFIHEIASQKFDLAINKLINLAEDPEMVSSMNALDSLHKISKHRSELQDYLLDLMLKIDSREYYKKGELSPECTNVAIGSVVDIFYALDKEKISKEMIAFAERNKNNSRPAVRKRIEKFLKKVTR